jgi:hypothetical protein
LTGIAALASYAASGPVISEAADCVRSVLETVAAALRKVAAGPNSFAALPAATGAPVIAGADQTLDDLWGHRTELVAQLRALNHAYELAEASLLDWTRPGPKYRYADGNWSEAGCGWPQIIEEAELPAYRPLSGTNMRPSLADIRWEFECRINNEWTCSRDKARKIYRQRVLEWVARLRRQREERERAGLPALERRKEAVCDDLIAIEDRIELLPRSPQRTAAVVLQRMSHCDITANVRFREDYEVAEVALVALRPELDGLIAAHVDELLAANNVCMKDLSFAPA